MIPRIKLVSILLSDLFSLILIGIYLVKKKHGKSQFLLTIYLFYSLLTDYIINPIIKHLFHDYSIGLRIYTILEFFIFSIYFLTIIGKSHRLLILFLTSIFFILSILDFSNNNYQFDSIPTGTSSIILISLSVIFFYKQLKELNSLFLYSTADFWNVVGILMYFSGTLFLFIYSQNNFENLEFKILFNSFLTVFSIIRNVLWLVGLLISNKT